MATHTERTRWLDRLVAWSPIALLAGLAALTWWLDAQVNIGNGGRDGNARHDPDLFAEGVRAVELDASGNPVQTLAATRARHDPDDGTVEFEAPRFVMTQPERPRFAVTADRARVSGDRENAYFEGNVKASRAGEIGGEDPAGPITLTTEFLHVIPKLDRAQTDRAVTIEEPRGIIRGRGFTFDNKAKTVDLKSNVSGTFQPSTEPAK